jgi:nucleotide-binding universal stress UspA family protein
MVGRPGQIMKEKPIVVGVDASPAGAHAAETGVMLAELMGVSCRLVHASNDVWVGAAGGGGLVDVATMTTQVADLARATVLKQLQGRVPESLLDSLLVRPGPVARVLSDVSKETGAQLVVLGAKRHSTIERWLGGSTAKNAVRALHCPVLVTTGPERIERVLVAVDLSEMARPTLETAQTWAGRFGASLRVLHVIEPLLMGTEGMPVLDVALFDAEAEKAFDSATQPEITYPKAERVVRRGSALAGIEAEATAWKADLIVVGAHGRGRMERLFLGSVSEGIVNSLPASVLVVRT